MRSELLVAAASSLTDALTVCAKAFEAQHPGVQIRTNFAASGMLLQQIRQGAPVDVFVSASPWEMDTLQRERRIDPRSRVVVAENRLVLIGPGNSPLNRWEDLTSPNVTRIALANPQVAPAGRYAVQALTRRRLWKTLEKKTVYGESVRQALAYVAGGNADAGLVFATDARAEKRVRVIAAAMPGRDHDPIAYPAAVVASRPNGAAARRFVAFLNEKPSRDVFVQLGFAVPDPRRRL